MKHLALATLLGISGLSGCIIYDDTDHHHGGGGGDDDGGGGVGTQLLTAHWEIKNVANQTVTNCPAGFNTGNIITQEVDDAGNYIGRPQNDLFLCDDHIDSILVPPGKYLVSVAIENRDDDANLLDTFQVSLADQVDLTRTDATYTTQLLADGGRLTFGWDLVDSAQKPLTCDALGTTGTLGSIVTDVADATHVTDSVLDCSDSFVPVVGPKALTGDIELVKGDYTVQIQATNNGLPLSDAVTKTFTMGDRDDLQDLGNVKLTITPETTPAN